ITPAIEASTISHAGVKRRRGKIRFDKTTTATTTNQRPVRSKSCPTFGGWRTASSAIQRYQPVIRISERLTTHGATRNVCLAAAEKIEGGGASIADVATLEAIVSCFLPHPEP